MLTVTLLRNGLDWSAIIEPKLSSILELSAGQLTNEGVGGGLGGCK